MYPHHQREILFFVCLDFCFFVWKKKDKKKRQKKIQKSNKWNRKWGNRNINSRRKRTNLTTENRNRKADLFRFQHTHGRSDLDNRRKCWGRLIAIPLHSKKWSLNFISFWLLNVHLSTANFYYVIAQICRDVVPTGTNTPGEVIKEVLLEFFLRPRKCSQRH